MNVDYAFAKIGGVWHRRVLPDGPWEKVGRRIERTKIRSGTKRDGTVRRVERVRSVITWGEDES